LLFRFLSFQVSNPVLPDYRLSQVSEFTLSKTISSRLLFAGFQILISKQFLS